MMLLPKVILKKDHIMNFNLCGVCEDFVELEFLGQKEWRSIG